MRVRVSDAAEVDLADLFDFTLTRWDERQARTYLAGLHQRLADYGAGAAIARPVPERTTLLQLGYRSHHLFFAPEPGGVLLVRVLHRRSDAARHLP